MENEGGEREILIIFSLLVFFRSMKIRPSDFVEAEGKIDLRNESYAWTPKSWSIDKLHKV